MVKSPISHFNFQQFEFSSHLAFKREGFVGRKWFFLELDNIFETDRNTAGVLITGEPGSGKSALMSQLICSPHSSLLIHQNIIGYHLCEYSEKGKRDGARFVRNLVDQIAARLPGYSDYVIKNEQMRKELDTLCHQDVTGCFFTSILGPLRELKPPNSLRYIVIDALDECFENDKKSEIIEVLGSKIPHLPKWLKFILTSRNLTIVTSRIPGMVRRIPLYANDERNVGDIHSYVSQFISKNSFFIDRLKTAMNFKSRTYDMKVFLGEVVTQAEGNFLFVKMSLQYMNDTHGVVDLRSSQTSLFDLYQIFFDRHFGKDGFGPFRSLFEIMLAVESPLHLNDIEEILRSEYKAEDISHIIDQASCFLRFGRDGTVRIYHQSFAEWLIIKSDVIQLNKTRSHQSIAKFLLHQIRERNASVNFGQVTDLLIHMLKGNIFEMYRNTIDLFNITEIREPRTNQSILHHLATKPRSFKPVLEVVLPKFKSVDLPDASGKTPAFIAATEGFTENLRSFINKGADVTSFLKEFVELDRFRKFVHNTGMESFSFMHAAAAKGHKEVVELLIKYNVSFKESTQSNPTPLHLAAGNGHLEVLQLFYDLGEKPDVISLHHAAARNHLNVVEFLLKTAGVRDHCLPCTCKSEGHSKFSVEDVHLYFCETALHAAVSRGYMDIVKILLSYGNETLECKHYSGKTVLMDAVERNDIEMVELLLDNGANVTMACGTKISKQSRVKLCSLYSVFEEEFLYTVYCVKDYCKCGNTAIHTSAKYGFWEVAEKLVRENVFHLTRIDNCDGESAVDVAISHGQKDFVHYVNETFANHDRVLVDYVIARGAVVRCSDNAVKHILDYPFNIYEHVWEFLLHIVTSWKPYMIYKIDEISSYIPSDAYEDENLSFREWIKWISLKQFAIFKLLIESHEDKSLIARKKDATGMTLLHHSVKNGFDDAAKYLVTIGADTRVKDANGDSAITLVLGWNVSISQSNVNGWQRCYTTSDARYRSCNTTSYDEILRYMIWWERKNFTRCSHRRTVVLDNIIEKQMTLSLYELLKAGGDIRCSESRPFLKYLRLGEQGLSKVFQTLGTAIKLDCGVAFTSSELHLLSYLTLPNHLSADFFRSVKKQKSILQRLIDKHPDGVGILDKCYDEEGYLPLHRAAQGGNIDAIKWFKSVGVNTQLKTKRGLTALDISILFLGNIRQAELIASLKITPYIGRNNFWVPLTISDYRKAVFEELLETFFNTTPLSELPCGARLEGLSPLHIAAVKGMNVLHCVHRVLSEMFPNLSFNSVNTHWLDPVYVANFYGFGPFRSLFEIILAVDSPLHLNDMKEILRSEYEVEDISHIIDQASCFLQFGRDGTVRIYHQSFAEWLSESDGIHLNKTRGHQRIAKFLLNRVRERNVSVNFGQVIELFTHMLKGNIFETYRNTIDLFNITEIREPRTNQSILHHLATKSRSFKPVLEVVLPKFKSVDLPDASGKTPAFYAATEGFTENLRSFINRGADVTSSLKGFVELDRFQNFVHSTGMEGFSFMHVAAAKGHKEVVELLIKSNVSFKESNQSNPTPLHLAAGNGHLDVLRLFYDLGEKPDVISLHHAAARNHKNVVKFLLGTAGVRDHCLPCTCKPEGHSKFSVEDVHLYFCETALHAAVSRGYMDIAKVLLTYGNETLECKHYSGKTVLMDAVERNDIEMVELLLHKGANVTMPCGTKISKRSRVKLCSLYFVFEEEFLYTVYCVKDHCKCGNTAIHTSAKYGFWEVAEKLVSENVFHLTRIDNCDEESAVDVAISHGQKDFVYHINETYIKRHGHILTDHGIAHDAVVRCSDNAIKHILDYPFNIYEHVWDFLLHVVTSWKPYMIYKIEEIASYIPSDAYEDENRSFGEWIEWISSKQFAIFKLLIESYKDKSLIAKKKDDKGMTLLHHCVKNGFDDAAKYLVTIGADSRVKNANGDSAITLVLGWFMSISQSNLNGWHRCYTTNDARYHSCNTTSYDEILRYIIWWERKNFTKCSHMRAVLLEKIIAKQMTLSLYELLKAGGDIRCSESRPFLKYLRLGERSLSKVFQTLGTAIKLDCGVTFAFSELHLLSYLTLPNHLSADFFRSVNKQKSLLQKLIDKHPDGVGILDKCFDKEGYLPIHRAAQGGNIDAIKWFKSVGVNTQLKTKRGLTALDISILYLGNTSQAEFIAPIASVLHIKRSNLWVPLTISDYRKAVFEELLKTFFNATSTSEFPCGARLEGLSPLHIAAVKGMKVLYYVHGVLSEMFPNLSINCVNVHRLDPVYVANFYESILNEGLNNNHSHNFETEFEGTKTSKKKDPKTDDNVNYKPRSDRNNFNEKDSRRTIIQYPDHEVEYYMAFSYLNHPPSCPYTDEHIHKNVPVDLRLSDCPGYLDEIYTPKAQSGPDFTECSKIPDSQGHLQLQCNIEVLTNYSRKLSCEKMISRLKLWSVFMSRPNRQISRFIAERLSLEIKDTNDHWPVFFLHNIILKKYASLEYMMVLNEALEVSDVRFYYPSLWGSNYCDLIQ